MKKQYVIKDLVTLTFWTGFKEDGDMFNNRVGNAKLFNSKKAARNEIKTFTTTTGGCYLSHTVLEIIEVYLTSHKK